MNIHIHRGQNQIGGSIIEITDNKTRLFFDIGINLAENERFEKYYLQAKHVLDVSLLDNYDKIKTSVALLRKELGL